MNGLNYQISTPQTDRITIGKKLILLPTIDSTNSWLLQQVDLLFDPHVAVRAEIQTGGRGRMDRHWFGGKHKHLYCSIVLHSGLPPGNLPVVTLLVGLAVFRTLERLDTKELSIKWPNDILIRNKKVSGILCELKTLSDGTNVVVAGIGINLGGEADQFPIDLRDRATTLDSEGIDYHNTDRIYNLLLDQLDRIFQLDFTHKLSPLLKEWERASSSIGKRIRFKEGEKELQGIIGGLDEQGHLKVKTDQNTNLVVISGEVIFIQ